MGLRFRKSIKMGPFRLNLSKSGIGYSVGVKGYRVTKTATGRTRTTVSIPGTGISHVTETPAAKRTSQTHPAQVPEKEEHIGLQALAFTAIVVLLIVGAWFLAVFLQRL